MIEFKVELMDIKTNRGSMSVRMADSVAPNTGMQGLIDFAEAQSDAAVVDFSAMQKVDITLPSGLKTAYAADAHKDSNVKCYMTNSEGVLTTFKVPVNSVPTSLTVPSVITNAREETLVLQSFGYSN